MNPTVRTLSLATVATLLWLATAAQADELRFSDFEKRIAPPDSSTSSSLNVIQTAFLSDTSTTTDSSTMAVGDLPTVAPHPLNSTQCACPMSECEPGCDSLCCGVYYADVHLMFLRTHMLENAVGKLSEKYELSPRFVVGYEGPMHVGARVRYWTYGRWTPNLDGGDALRFEMDVTDIESTCRFRTPRTDLVLAGGLRWANVDVTLDDEEVNIDMPGLTVAADVRTALCRSDCRQWSMIGGARWSVMGGDWEGDGGLIEPVRDDNITIDELYAGVEYMCVYGDHDLFARLLFEVQNWHSDAIAQDAGTDSFGFVGPGLQFGMMF